MRLCLYCRAGSAAGQINSFVMLSSDDLEWSILHKSFNLPIFMPESLFKVKRLSDLAAAGLLKGRRVLIRADLNVPQDDVGNITEDTRIRASMPAVQMCLDAGAAVMVTSHLGRPTEGEFKPEDSLAPVADRIATLLNRKVPLISNWVNGGFEVNPGELVLLENCRLNVGEKKNSDGLAKARLKASNSAAINGPAQAIGANLATPLVVASAR